MPIPKHNEFDSGPYITAALLIARNPETGVQNVSIHRCQISGPDRIGVLLLPRHTQHYFRMAEQKGEALEVALVIGVHPACLLVSRAILALDKDEMEVASALLGRPIEMVKCKTNQVCVPAHAEIVLEGCILSQVREPERSFGEFPQYYGARADREVIVVDTITHRRDAIYHAIVGGGAEHLVLAEIPREATILVSLQRNFTAVREVRLEPGRRLPRSPRRQDRQENRGRAQEHHHGGVWQPLRHQAGDRRRHGRRHRRSQRGRMGGGDGFQADRDIITVPPALGSRLDPAAQDGISAKMGLDATKPITTEPLAFRRIHVKGIESVDLDSVLQQDPDAAFVRLIGGGGEEISSR